MLTAGGLFKLNEINQPYLTDYLVTKNYFS